MVRMLWLFDVDGTLMITCGAGSRCIRRAMRKLFGDDFQWTSVTVGLLDPQIYQQLAAHNAIDTPDSYHDQYREIYLHELKKELNGIGDDVKVLGGVREMLDALRQRDDVAVGLLTGNYKQAVKLKFTAAGIDFDQFLITAFAEDGETRDQLVRHAMRQYESLNQVAISPRHVVVIGDTPRDVACAHACGCVSLGVATGRYTVRQLSRAGADVVVGDLSNHQAIFDRLLNLQGGRS